MFIADSRLGKLWQTTDYIVCKKRGRDTF